MRASGDGGMLECNAVITALAYVLLVGGLLVGGLSVGGCVYQPPQVSCLANSTRMARVELLFGATRQNGEAISATEWATFLNEEVTPRFPAGFTAFAADGQWRRPDGRIIKTPSRVLLVWYAAGKDASARVDALREAYKSRFAQLSVMRIDGADCVSF